jgi:hypothetical protein
VLFRCIGTLGHCCLLLCCKHKLALTDAFFCLLKFLAGRCCNQEAPACYDCWSSSSWQGHTVRENCGEGTVLRQQLQQQSSRQRLMSSHQCQCMLTAMVQPNTSHGAAKHQPWCSQTPAMVQPNTSHGAAKHQQRSASIVLRASARWQHTLELPCTGLWAWLRAGILVIGHQQTAARCFDKCPSPQFFVTVVAAAAAAAAVAAECSTTWCTSLLETCCVSRCSREHQQVRTQLTGTHC